MGTFKYGVMVVLGIVLFGWISAAQAIDSVGSKTWSIGNSLAGASATLSTTQSRNATLAKTSFEGVGAVKLLGLSAKAADFKATGQKTPAEGRVTYALKVAGFTVDSGSKRVDTTWQWAKSITQTVVSASKTFVVAGIPVTVRGSVGGSAKIGVGYTFGVQDITANGDAGAWGNGSGSGGVNIGVAKAGVEANLKLLNTTLRTAAKVGFNSWSGKVQALMTPYDIRLALASYYRTFSCSGWSCGFKWKAGPSLQLARFAGSSQTVNLCQLY